MAASLVFRSKKDDSGSSDQTINIQLYPGKEFTVKRTPDDQSSSHNLATFVNGRNSLNIDSGLVSKNHFRIYGIQYEDADGIESMFYCEDSRSANGTYVNRMLIGRNDKSSWPFLLSDGDKIKLKPDFSFKFKHPIERQREEMDAIQLEETASFAKRYSITDRLLGSGICGKVYLATEVATKRQLACKVVNLRVAVVVSEDDQARERTMRLESQRLIREIEILTRVNHPNIVAMKKAFRSDNSLYLFMELAPGGDLCSFVSANGGHLTDLDTRVILRQLTIAVQYLHSVGIVHRDIKPENILMMNTAVGYRVVLTDFGCAANLHAMSRMESLVGTFDYVAPEVHRTERLNGTSYTKAVDMWSLGIVAFCLLTGESLASYLEMKHISQEDITARLDQIRPDLEGVTDQAKDFLTKLLVLDPAHRMTADEAIAHIWFTTPSELNRELERLYKRSIEGWVPRGDIYRAVECIPRNGLLRDMIRTPSSQFQANSDEPHQASQKEMRRSRKPSDYTASVYFSLDKHTRKHSHRHHRGREATQRSKQQIINALNESGELFVKDGDVSSYTSPSRKRARRLLKRVRDVPPTDLLGKVPAAGANSQRSQSKKSRKLSQSSSNAVTRPDYVDSSQTQLEQPSLLTEEALSILPGYESRATRSRRWSTEATHNGYVPDSFYDSLADEMKEYFKGSPYMEEYLKSRHLMQRQEK
ncbi:Meiosis-specific serine/threonine-protein kinase mek1 [Pseudogymnoascus destructans]|uniref:CAMK protein kinase n=2 Tax=Pseudogymnoascus destructans TaxID=655981 RepID=L8FPQ2_PSED2|nr:Meiosis-specific serine/threonine-protein kinase mek1 [Pseudogymnoascus destructans]ELR02468.1 CAMK protein kinase [Pseudogymnoascus destructans 20631-21]OAF55794.1 Meiosis-specific serine/threonine-protein kinase mek1 [Pseudogymnoascus destructans]